ALAVRDSGRVGLIVAGDSFGQGSSREHAAICPMYLGVRLVLAINVERILAANLVNFGILPLLFQNQADLEAIQPSQKLTITGLRAQLAPAKAIAATLVNADGSQRELTLTHNLSPEDIATVLQGGKLAG
ncbi:MAG TPA: aconitate hydratase, partial [Lentisphaeria bacterium]|nr:aconitate hydratase [Lentisphaeria bacterium]